MRRICPICDVNLPDSDQGVDDHYDLAHQDWGGSQPMPDREDVSAAVVVASFLIAFAVVLGLFWSPLVTVAVTVAASGVWWMRQP